MNMDQDVLHQDSDTQPAQEADSQAAQDTDLQTALAQEADLQATQDVDIPAPQNTDLQMTQVIVKDSGAPKLELTTGSTAYASAPEHGPSDGPWNVPAAGGLSNSDVTNELIALNKKIDGCCELLKVQQGRMRDRVDNLEDQMNQLLNKMGIKKAEGAMCKPKQDVIEDLQGLMQLYNTVEHMQEQLRNVHETAMQLAADKEHRKNNINNLIEQIELLKIIKLDREDMMHVMSEKADVRQLARKVSHGQFEAACDDLAKGLELAIGKLNLQESLWQQALDDIQREIETKLNKVELNPVKEFFMEKLKQLQENLKQLAQLHREVEATGTKKRLLRDVTCLTCDANAVMNMEAGPSLPVGKPLTATHSVKPYLTYELDSIRKAQSANMQQRKLKHDWEKLEKKMGEQPFKLPDTGKHQCSRYCGGSHTTTTPAQRVARTGHFVKQWGPDVLPLRSVMGTGDDGKIYRVTEVQMETFGGTAEKPCTPKRDSKRTSKQLSPPVKPLVVSAECRCLEKGT